MAEGKRPGGLTALAVLNFVFGGLGAIFLLGVFALLGAAKQAGANLSEGAAETGTSIGGIYLSLLLGLVAVILLITSGVGYIKQKRFLGRTLGNVYAVVSITNTVVSTTLASASPTMRVRSREISPAPPRMPWRTE